MRPARPWQDIEGAAGSILLEVVVATLLVCILVVPLASAFSRSLGEARATRQRVAGASSADTRQTEAWEWGPRVVAAWWRGGPVLHLRVSGTPGQGEPATRVGLWADGWLLAELTPPAGAAGRAGADELQAGSEQWAGLADRELVVRVRSADGSWGPPWRLAVPGAAAGGPALGSAAASPQSPAVVVHRPSMGTSSLTVSWSAAPLSSPPFGLLFSLAPDIQGWGGATLDGRSQWWWMEEGRSADLYF